MIVCHCYKVTDKQIKDCIKNNLDPVKETKAGTGCRSCRPEVNKIIKETKDNIMQNDYNYHDWAKFMVQKPEQAPKGPHYAAVLLGTKYVYSPPYDRNDSASSYEVPDVTYFAFDKKEDLELWVDQATRADKKFFFFQVTKLGASQVKVELDI